jgi:capsular polysaccharide biosynthesis protein
MTARNGPRHLRIAHDVSGRSGFVHPCNRRSGALLSLDSEMKRETLRNLLTSRSRLARRLQLVLFHALRSVGLSGPLGLVQGVRHLAAEAPSTFAGEATSGLSSVAGPDHSRLGTKAPAPCENNHSEFLEVGDGHCLVTSGYFEVAILDGKRRLIAELSPDTYAPREHRALRQVPLRREAAQRLCVLVTPGARANYYHWMVDLMPAFRVLSANADPGLRHAALLINHSGRPYQRECLEALNLRVDVISARTYTLYSAAHLYARRLPQTCFSLQDARFLRSLFGVQESDASVDLYVARGHTRRRRIRNEAEVIGLMRRLGFRIFDPSGHTVREQARLFASARKIIGFHGAGLTNAVFCGQDTTFVEIFDRGYVADHYSTIAAQLGLGYRRIVHGVSSTRRLAGIAEDISVDIGILEAELECVI